LALADERVGSQVTAASGGQFTAVVAATMARLSGLAGWSHGQGSSRGPGCAAAAARAATGAMCPSAIPTSIVAAIAAVPPILVKSASNPEGIPIEVFDGLRSSLAKDRSQFYKDFAVMFYGANRPGASVSQGIMDQFWLWSMQAGLKNAYDSIKAFSETDFTEDLKKFDVPTLVMHGEDDQVVPIKDSAKKSARLIKGAKEIYYPGKPHGLTSTDQDEVNADLLKFLRSVQEARKAA